MTIANHGQINVFMLQPADIIVVGGRVVVVLGVSRETVKACNNESHAVFKEVYSFNGVVTSADDDGNINDAVQTFTDFTADATFPRLLVVS